MSARSPGLTTRRGVLKGLGASLASSWALPGCGRRSEVTPQLGPLADAVAASCRSLGASGTVRVLHPKGSRGNLAPVADAFRRATGHGVELIEGSLDEIAAEVLVSSALAGDPGFDVALPASFAVPDLVEGETLLPLDDLAAAYAPGGLQDGALYTLGDRYQGRLYGYQVDGDVYMMFYDRSRLEDPDVRARYADQHGRELEVPLTWAELDRQLAFFHEPEAGRYGGSLFRTYDYAIWEFWGRLHGKGRYPFSDGMQPRLSSPQAVEALEELTAATRWLEPGVLEDGLFANWASYGDGTRYANVGWGGSQKALRGPDSVMRDRLVHGPLPGGRFGGVDVPMPYFNWGWNLVVAASTRIPELAFHFLAFASAPAISTRAVRDPTGFFDPHHVAHYEDDAVRALFGDGFLEVHRRSLQACIPDLYLRGQGRYMQVLKQAVQLAILGRAPAAEALRHAQERWERLTDELGREGQIRQWAFIKQSYPETIARVLS